MAQMSVLVLLLTLASPMLSSAIQVDSSTAAAHSGAVEEPYTLDHHRRLASTATTSASCSAMLGSAACFGVLAGGAVSSTGATYVSGGDVGTAPGTAITGLLPSQTTGSLRFADAIAAAAQGDAGRAFTALTGLPAGRDLTGTDLMGLILTPGVYSFASSGALGVGTLTLDAQGSASALFVIRTVSTLITSAASQVVLINGAQACNVFFVVGSSATLGAASTVRGSVLAYASITVSAGAVVQGSVLALTGAITLASNPVTVAVGACVPPAPPSPGGPCTPLPAGCTAQAAFTSPVVGVLPAYLSGQLSASPLSVSLLSQLPSMAAAASQAQQLQAAFASSGQSAVVGNLFVAWSVAFQQKYTSVAQSCAAYSALADSACRVLAANAGAPAAGYWAGYNQFSGLTLVQANTLLQVPLARKPSNHTAPVRHTAAGRRRRHLMSTAALLPTFVNWTATGRTTPVKNQGGCGSCYANSGLAAIEAAVAIAYPTSTPTRFSRQVVVSCANSNINGNFASQGCNAGAVDDTMGFAAIYTMPLESTYPYTATTGTCNQSMLTLAPSAGNSLLAAGGSDGFQWLDDQQVYGYDNVIYVPTNSEAALMAALVIQPVAFYWALSPKWYNYAGGIFTGTDCGSSINHGMLLVGFDAINKFWIVQNSWDVTWGINGFAKVAMDGSSNGICQMYTFLAAPMASFLTVPSSIFPAPPRVAAPPPVVKASPPSPPRPSPPASPSPRAPPPKSPPPVKATPIAPPPVKASPPPAKLQTPAKVSSPPPKAGLLG